MPFTLYDYLDASGSNPIQGWIAKLQVKERAKLNERLDKLGKEGHALYPNIVSDTTIAGIKKLRVHGGVQLRPMLCEGPIDRQAEFTFLIGAIEKQSKLVPANAETVAKSRKNEIQADPQNRRTLNVRSPKPPR